ncbi:MAG: DUF2914 domain-containing protein [bacterium]|nr:DUF2914 domain-containing protein [bacterium]
MRKLVIALCLLALASWVRADQADNDLEQSTIEVKDSGLGLTLVDRMLVETSDRFSTGDKVYLWCRLIGGNDGDIIHHVWYYEDREIQNIELPVGGEHWRTWSYKTLFGGMTGQWRVEIRSESLEMLAEHKFTVTEQDSK